MSKSATPIDNWLHSSSADELREGVLFLQHDAAFAYRRAAVYRDRGLAADTWIACKVQEAAAHSARYARAGLERLNEVAA